MFATQLGALSTRVSREQPLTVQRSFDQHLISGRRREIILTTTRRSKPQGGDRCVYLITWLYPQKTPFQAGASYVPRHVSPMW